MRDRTEAIAATLGNVSARLAERLRGSEWEAVPRPHRWRVGSFVRPMVGAFVATVEVFRIGQFHLRGDNWPVDLYTRFGCGFQPAAILASKVGIDVGLSLVEEWPAGGLSEGTTRLSSQVEATAVADKIASQILSHDLTFVKEHASIDGMVAALRDRTITPVDVEVELLPIFMAAIGNSQEALRVLDSYIDSGIEEANDPEYLQYARRLRDYVMRQGT